MFTNTDGRLLMVLGYGPWLWSINECNAEQMGFKSRLEASQVTAQSQLQWKLVPEARGHHGEGSAAVAMH